MNSLNKFKSLLVAILFIGLNVNGQTVSDYTTMKTRLFNSIYSPASFDTSICNPDGTFTTVVYPTTYPTDFTGGARPHLDVMFGIAMAYNTPGTLFKSQELMDAFIKSWNWWYTTNPTDLNWWYRSIGFPNSLYSSFVLMADDLKTNNPDAFNTLRNYLLAEWTPQFYAESLSNPEGANTSDVAYYTFATAVSAGVDSITVQTIEVLTNLIDIQTTAKGEGIHPDFSFSAHSGTGRQLYLGNYGKEYMGGIIRFMVMTDNTSLEIPAERITIFENLFLEGASWVAYRNIFDHHQHGRRVMPTDGYTKTLACLNTLIGLNTPQKAKLQELSNWMSRSEQNNTVNIQQGNKMFWRHDYMVHKGSNYFTSHRMSSTRVIGSESANGEGLNNYYTGSGVNYLYITGQEYLEIWDDMNWRRLPGITAPQKPMTTALPDVKPTSQRGLNGDSYAGGTSDGKTGVTGFKYNKVHATEVSVSANKSVFYHEDYYVVLGSNIRAAKTYGVPFATTINQVKYKDNFVIDNNGSPQNVANDQAFAPATSDWAYLNNVGYQFLSKTNLNFEVKTVGASPIAWMAFNHGNQPNGASYSYAVYPNISETEFTNKRLHTPFSIVANNALMQSVVDTVSKIAQIVFYIPGRIELPGDMGVVECDQPAVLQLRWKNDSVYVNMANPYCESRNVFNLKVTISGQYTGESASVDEANNVTVISTPMPLNEYQGSTQSVSVVKKGFSGIDNINTSTSKWIYPTKMSAGTPITFITTEGNSQVMVSLYRMDGTLVQQQTITPNHENRVIIDTKGLPANMYIVRANSKAGKIIIE